MINKLNNSNCPSFQANLKVSGLNLGSAKKLKEVERLFAEKTRHYADDVLEISHLKNQNDLGRFFHTAEFDLNGKNVASKILGGLKDFCKENSPEDVAKGLVRIFKYGKAKGKFALQHDEKVKNLRRVLALDLHNTKKSIIKEKDGNSMWAKRFHAIAEGNKARAAALKGEIEKIDNKKNEVFEKITDHPIFDDCCL